MKVYTLYTCYRLGDLENLGWRRHKSVFLKYMLELLKSNNNNTNNKWRHLPDYHPSGDNHPRMRWKSREGVNEEGNSSGVSSSL